MKLTKIFSLLTLLSAALIVSGCSTSQTAGGTNHTVVLGGLYKSKEAAYEPVSVLTFHTSQDDWFPSADYTGTKVSFFWGLITYTDY